MHTEGDSIFSHSESHHCIQIIQPRTIDRSSSVRPTLLIVNVIHDVERRHRVVFFGGKHSPLHHFGRRFRVCVAFGSE
jgi:hypothetical protein